MTGAMAPRVIDPRRPAVRPEASARAAALVALAGCGAAPAAPSAPSCPVDRDVVVASRADVARLAGCQSLRGLTVRSGAPLDISALRALSTITGDLVIGPTVGVEEVTLGALRAVGGAIHVVGNGLLRGLYLPNLERAGRVDVDGNAAVTTIALPRLAATGALWITDNASLALVDVSALVSIEHELVLAGAPSLDLVEAGQLQRAGAVRLDVPKLPPEVAERLRAAAAPPP